MIMSQSHYNINILCCYGSDDERRYKHYHVPYSKALKYLIK